MPDRNMTNAAPQALVEGQRLDQPTFHALYEATPPGVRAELIDGVVFMPSPVSRDHSRSQADLMVWLGYYRAYTPGAEVLDNATTVLGWKSETQPDALLRILSEYGGLSQVEQGYIHGAPELVVEVSKATRYVDLGPKRDDYERAGVLEYVVHAIDPEEIFWYGREHGAFVQRTVGADGFYRSTVFPGLWLDPIALLNGDTRRLLAVVELGCATPEHAAFGARLGAARQQAR